MVIHEEIDGNPYDYWKDFKDEVRHQLKKNGTKEDLKDEEKEQVLKEGFTQRTHDMLSKIAHPYKTSISPTR